MALLEVEDLRAYYRTEVYGISRSVRAVDGVSLTLHRNEIYGIAGESSCGKTTLIKSILGLIEPAAGQILVRGVQHPLRLGDNGVQGAEVGQWQGVDQYGAGAGATSAGMRRSQPASGSGR